MYDTRISTTWVLVYDTGYFKTNTKYLHGDMLIYILTVFTFTKQNKELVTVLLTSRPKSFIFAPRLRNIFLDFEERQPKYLNNYYTILYYNKLRFNVENLKQ
jgi:hypothetical protein